MSQMVNAKSQVSHILRAIEDRTILSREIQEQYLAVLEAFECWIPYFELLEGNISDPRKRDISDYVRLASVHYLYLEDPDKTAETCAKLVKDLKLGYEEFRLKALNQVIDEEDFGTEAKILEKIFQILQAHACKITCLERLCLIYEKKKYNENRLNESYEKLISVDPANVKALRFFKVVFTQNNEWEEVARILRTLHANSKHAGDGYRIAQELATVYLYQLDRPEEAIRILETFCGESPLDTSTVHFDAYKRISDWEGCMKVLRNCLDRVDSNQSRAVLHYKIGEMQTYLENFEEAEHSFYKSHSLNPKFLEPLESLIDMNLAKKDWGQTLNLMKTLRKNIVSPELTERIDEAITRLQDGLTSAS